MKPPPPTATSEMLAELYPQLTPPTFEHSLFGATDIEEDNERSPSVSSNLRRSMRAIDSTLSEPINSTNYYYLVYTFCALHAEIQRRPQP